MGINLAQNRSDWFLLTFHPALYVCAGIDRLRERVSMTKAMKTQTLLAEPLQPLVDVQVRQQLAIVCVVERVTHTTAYRWLFFWR